MTTFLIFLLLVGLIVGFAIIQTLAQEQQWESIPIPVRVSEKNSFISPNLRR
jgi:F0F1-type ATP synthase assembly protein I